MLWCFAKSVPARTCVLTHRLSRRFEAILRGHSATVTCLAASLDGSFLLSGSADQEVHTYDFAKMHAHRLRSTHSFEPRAPHEVVSLALNPHVRCGRLDAARGFDTRHIALVATNGVSVPVAARQCLCLRACARGGERERRERLEDCVYRKSVLVGRVS